MQITTEPDEKREERFKFNIKANHGEFVLLYVALYSFLGDDDALGAHLGDNALDSNIPNSIKEVWTKMHEAFENHAAPVKPVKDPVEPIN